MRLLIRAKDAFVRSAVLEHEREARKIRAEAGI